jgi:hypothetical protein
MKDLRMSKGWALVGTNALGFGNIKNKYDVYKREQKFRNAIKNAKKLKEEDLIKETEEAATAQETSKQFLLNGYNKKLLKSKTLIKEAKSCLKKATTDK